MFSSKITTNFYILIFKEHTRHISNDLKIKRKNLCWYKSYLQKFYRCNVPENVRRQISKFIVW